MHQDIQQVKKEQWSNQTSMFIQEINQLLQKLNIFSNKKHMELLLGKFLQIKKNNLNGTDSQGFP